MKVLIYLSLLLLATAPTRAADDHVVMVEKVDAEMNQAIAAAKKSLPEFWRAFKEPAFDESEFYVKLAISDGLNVEHFWIGDIRRRGGAWVGVVANDPELITSVKYGQEVTIDDSKISDWKYLKAKVTKGGFTIAVLLSRLPKAEADEFRKQLGWSKE